MAERFLDRLIGLIGKSGLATGEGLLLRPCNDIHMWMMRFPIDVVFAKPSAQNPERWIVTSTHAQVRAWKLLPLRDRKASVTFELPVGTIDRCAIQKGDELCSS